MNPYAQQPCIDEYRGGPQRLRQAVMGLSASALDAVPIAGKWSTRQVVCHVADFEVVYADRMKRVIAECEPTFFGGDPDVFAARLAYGVRDVEEELQVIESVRRQMARILGTLDVTAFQRIGNHSENGPLTLAVLLRGVTDHLTHHTARIHEKVAAM